MDTINQHVTRVSTMQKNTSYPPRWGEFLQAFSDRIGAASTDLRSARCITQQTFSSLLADIARQLKLAKSFPSGKTVISHLCGMGIAHRIDVGNAKDAQPSKEFYLVTIGASQDPMVDPLELLQAYRNDGVICFFSALSYYDLTTQMPKHHHVATIVNPPAPVGRSSRRSAQTTPRITKRQSLGTLAFSYEGSTFYSTKRRRNTIPGIKNRILTKRTMIRITTLEQTLLDTLQYPAHCGGPEVVFEAWEGMSGNADEEKILDHLNRIGSHSLDRRLGALFDLLDCRPRKPLLEYLNKARETLRTEAESYDISLMRGIKFTKLNPLWKVLTP